MITHFFAKEKSLSSQKTNGFALFLQRELPLNPAAKNYFFEILLIIPLCVLLIGLIIDYTVYVINEESEEFCT